MARGRTGCTADAGSRARSRRYTGRPAASDRPDGGWWQALDPGSVKREIPGQIDEGVHGIGLARGCAPALRTDGIQGVAVERIARPIELDIIRQRHRQIALRHRHDTAGLAEDDQNRAAPIALAGDPPVAQPVVHLWRVATILMLPSPAVRASGVRSSLLATSSFASSMVMPSRNRELIIRPSPS